jgi:hypothetical protein
MLYKTPTEIITGSQRTIPNNGPLKNLPPQSAFMFAFKETWLASNVKDYFQEKSFKIISLFFSFLFTPPPRLLVSPLQDAHEED